MILCRHIIRFPLSFSQRRAAVHSVKLSHVQALRVFGKIMHQDFNALLVLSPFLAALVIYLDNAESDGLYGIIILFHVLLWQGAPIYQHYPHIKLLKYLNQAASLNHLSP